jgi:radical SAM modification target selenobiotic family peptide
MIEKTIVGKILIGLFYIHYVEFPGEDTMEKKDLKKLLASLGIASLISMGGITLPGAHAGSG